MSHNVHRVAIIGADPASLRAAEQLVRAGMCVDIVTSQTAPHGLLRHLGGGCPDGSVARLRLLGNVRVGEDLTIPEINAHAAAGDLPAELQRRGVAFTYWEGLCDATLSDAPIDWDRITTRASLAPVCF